MSVHSLKTGAAIAIGGKVEIDRTIARIANLPLKRSRASAYAANAPNTSDRIVALPATITLLRSACVKSLFLKIDWKLSSVGWLGKSQALESCAPVFSDVFTSQ